MPLSIKTFRRTTMKKFTFYFFCFAVFLASAQAQAWSFDRSNTWEGYFQLHYQLDERMDGKNNSYFKQKDDLGWGFGFGYNFTRKLQTNFAFTNTRSGYTINFGDDHTGKDHKGTSDYYGFQLNGQYAFLATKFTPIVQLGLGSATWDSNKVSSVAGGTCYVPWPPYYVTCGYYNTYRSSGFTYNAGLGARWDYSRTGFLKVIYIREYADLEFKKDVEFDTVSVQFGGKF